MKTNGETTVPAGRTGAVMDAQGYHCVGAADDWQVGRARRVTVGGSVMAVWRLEDGFYAVDDACPHQGASLAFGVCDGGIVACPRHGAQFDIRTGALRSLPAVRGVRSYPVKVAEGKVWVLPQAQTEPDILRLDRC